MTMKQKTIIVTGASQGIGAGIATLFLDRGYNVVGTSRHISSKNELRQSDHLALVDGDIGQTATAQHVVKTALERFGSVDALVNNAGIFFPKAFLDYSTEDFRALSSTNLDGFIYITQLVVKQMLSQKSNGSIVSSCERGSSRRGSHANAHGRSRGVPAHTLASWNNSRIQGHCRGRILSHRS